MNNTPKYDFDVRPTFDEARERREQDGTEWKVGAITKSLFAVPHDERLKYQSIGETQVGAQDTQDCASRDKVNDLETQLNYAYRNGLLIPEIKLFLDNNGYVVWKSGIPYIECSDAYIAIKSGTTRTGNSLKAPALAVHDWGLVPKKLLPLEPWMKWEDYHNPKRITPEIEALGKRFKAALPINFQQVQNFQFRDEILNAEICCAGHAWEAPVNGVYQKSNMGFNHAFKIMQREYLIQDNYVDPVDGDYIKNLAPDYRFFDWGYQMAFTAQNASEEEERLFSILELLKKSLESLEEFLRNFFPDVEDNPNDLPMNIPPKGDKLYQAAYSFIGKEASPNDLAPDEVACVDSLQEIYKSVFGTYLANHTLSTTELFYFLKRSPLFQRIDSIEKGCITIFPTNTNARGHVGIGGKTHVMSNDSKTGLWQANYTKQEWYDEAKRRGLPVFHFRLV